MSTPSANAFQARAQQNKLSYARPISAARPVSAMSAKIRTMRMHDKAIVEEEQTDKDHRLENLKNASGEEQLNDVSLSLLCITSAHTYLRCF